MIISNLRMSVELKLPGGRQLVLSLLLERTFKPKPDAGRLQKDPKHPNQDINVCVCVLGWGVDYSVRLPVDTEV